MRGGPAKALKTVVPSSVRSVEVRKGERKKGAAHGG
jgi:hypothetical protein